MPSASSRCPEKRKAPVFTEARRRPGYPQSLGELYLASRFQSIDVCVDLGRLFAGISRLLLAAVALFLGWLTPVHAIGPSSSVADDVVTIQMPAVAPPAVQVFLGAYREQGPPEITDSRSFNAAAVRIQQGTSLRFIFVVVCKSGRPARREDGLHGASSALHHGKPKSLPRDNWGSRSTSPQSPASPPHRPPKRLKACPFLA